MKAPKRGDTVLVKQSHAFEWRERIFVSEIPGADEPYVCVNPGYEENFANGRPFKVTLWKFMMPIEKKK